MAVDPRDILRVPNLPLGKIVDENGMPTDDELTFRQALVTLLQKLFGNEGVVMPSQPQANVTAIQNYTNPQGQKTCQFGTIIYIPSTTAFPAAPNDSLVVAFNDGTAAQEPVFKTITVT